MHSVAMLTLKRGISPLGRTVLLAIITVQLTFAGLTCWPLISTVRLVHSAGRLLYLAQPHLNVTRAKLTLATHYEMLTGREKFAFSVGSLSEVTTEALFKVGGAFLNIYKNLFKVIYFYFCLLGAVFIYIHFVSIVRLQHYYLIKDVSGVKLPHYF